MNFDDWPEWTPQDLHDMRQERIEQWPQLLRGLGQRYATFGCQGRCDGSVLLDAATVLARRIGWADNMWLLLLRIPAEHWPEGVDRAGILAEYTQVRDADKEAGRGA